MISLFRLNASRKKWLYKGFLKKGIAPEIIETLGATNKEEIF
jgi:hypothetical protein